MARTKSKNVGIIGLGIIGSRVAGALRKRGLSVYVWNRTPRPEQNFVGSPAEVAELCDVVQIFVSDDEALLDIVRQLSPGLTAQHVVTAHSTVSPETVRAAAEMVQRRGRAVSSMRRLPAARWRRKMASSFITSAATKPP